MMLITTQLDLSDYSPAAVERELPTLREGVSILSSRCDSISISGVPLAAALGRTSMLDLLEEARNLSGLECSTDIEAHILAMHHLGAEKIAMASRWPDDLNQRIVEYLNDAGIEVIAVRSEARDLARNKALTPEDGHALALRLGREALDAAPGAQALFMPGGLWFAIHAAPILEAESAVPVLLNITSTTWAALRHLSGSLPQPVPPGSGHLLATL
jgi:arylmalonate decarboxylase